MRLEKPGCDEKSLKRLPFLGERESVVPLICAVLEANIKHQVRKGINRNDLMMQHSDISFLFERREFLKLLSAPHVK